MSAQIQSALMDITPRPSQVFTRGQGAWLWDSDGRRYLDFVQGWAVNCLGHSPAAISHALANQSKALLSPSPAYYNQPAIDLAKLIVRHSVFDQVFFTNSGAEANEGAIKLARRWGKATGRYEIVTFGQAFHGRTLATMSASGKAAFEPLFEPKVPGFPKAVLNDIESVLGCINEHTVAIMLEPVQGEAGVFPATNEFMRSLRTLCNDRNLLLIVDEIQTGVGRTGLLWGYEHAAISPDIMTLGKGLGGGVPLAALVATNEASCFEYGDQGGTWCGNPLMTAVGIAVLEKVASATFMERVIESGQYLRQQLNELKLHYGLGEVRGQGLLLALELPARNGATIVDHALSAGLLINAPRDDCLRFMPALNVSRHEIDQMINLLSQVLRNELSRDAPQTSAPPK